MVLFAFFVSLVFAVLLKDEPREQLKTGAMMLGGFVVAAYRARLADVSVSVMSFENLLLERDGGVAILTINRPKVLNALNTQTLDELRRAILDLQARRHGPRRHPHRARARSRSSPAPTSTSSPRRRRSAAASTR